MKPVFVLAAVLLSGWLPAQVVDAAGSCFDSPANLPLSSLSPINGRPAYEGTASYASTSTPVAIYYDININGGSWVIDFGGQPGYTVTSTAMTPPASGWVRTASFNSFCSSTVPIMLSGSGILPVSWAYITGEPVAKGRHLIRWATTEEEDNSGFVIERAVAGGDWVAIGERPAGTPGETFNEYAFTDADPLPGRNYYRIRQTDYDGTVDYSSVVSVVAEQATLRVFPNPATDRINVTSDEAGTFQLLTAEGRTLLHWTAGPGTDTQPTTSISPGIYFLRRATAGGEVTTQKIILR